MDAPTTDREFTTAVSPLGSAFDEILADAQAGRSSALEAMYRDLAPSVLGYLRARGALEPEDLAADVFVSVVRGLGRFRGDEAGFRSWVFTIAHRRLVDERRRRSRRREDVHGPDTLAAHGGALGDAEVDALARLGDEHVERLLAELTDEQRAVVLLRVVADLSVSDVARVLGKREGAVKTLQRRALARLGRLLEAQRDDAMEAAAVQDDAVEAEAGEDGRIGQPFGERRGAVSCPPTEAITDT